MFNNLTALGLGIVIFAIVIGVGVTILSKFGVATATCPSGSQFVTALDKCCLTTVTNAECVGATNSSTATGGWTTSDYLRTQMGSSGLAGWAPAIIALAVGLLFIGALMMRKGKNY